MRSITTRTTGRTATRAVVLCTGTLGWIITWNAARANLYIEPTNDALQHAHDAVVRGTVGSSVLLGAAALRLTYRAWTQVAPLVVLTAWVLATFVIDPHKLGAWLWTLAVLPTALGTLVLRRWRRPGDA